MMGLIRHLAWCDLRSQRVPLLVWAAVLALQATAILVNPSLQPRLLDGLGVPVLRCLMTALLAALIIQRDALVGTTAFWLTRPVSRTTFFVSKLASLATVLVALPWVVVFVVWQTTGALTGDAVRAATAVAIEQGVVALLAVMAASVTSSLTHLVVAGIAGSTLVTVFNAILLPAILTTWPFVGQSMGGWQPTVYVVTLFVLGVPTIAHQYFTLREWRTAVMVAVTLLAATVVTRAWHPDVRTLPAHPVERSIVNPDEVVAGVDVETMNELTADSIVRGVGRRMTRFAAALTADGQPDAVLLWPMTLDSRLTLSDESVPYRSPPNEYGAISRPQSRTGKDLVRPAMQAAFGSAARFPEPPSSGTPGSASGSRAQGVVSPYRTIVASVPSDVLDAHAGRQATLTGNVTYRAYRYRVADIMEARRGGRFAFPGIAIEITSVAASDKVATVGFREFRVDYSSDYPFQLMTMPVFCLRNASRNEVFVLGRRGSASMVPLTLNFLRTGAMVFDWTWQVTSTSDAARRIDDKWLAGAEIVRLDSEYLGTFTRPLHAEFTLGPRPAR